jgi:hypothetical protein
MRFMLISKATPQSQSGGQPDPKLMAAVGELTDEMRKAGVLVGGGGLMPSAAGAKARLAGGKITLTDGPFTEIKELIGGYAIVDVKSRQEAIELARRFLQIHADILGPDYELDSEIRQMYA